MFAGVGGGGQCVVQVRTKRRQSDLDSNPSPDMTTGSLLTLLNHSFPISQFSSVQSFSRVRLFATPWIIARQASLSIFTQTHVHLVSDVIQPPYPLSPHSPSALNCSQHQSFPVSQLFSSGGQSIGASVSASVLPMHFRGWFPLGLTALISLQSKGLARVFSNTTIQRHQSVL